MPDDHLEDALRSLARHAEHTGRLPDPVDIHQRGRVRRRRRRAVTGTLVVVLAAGLTATQLHDRPPTRPPTAPPAPTSVPPSPSPSPSPSIDPLLSGTREVSIVRTQAPGSAVSLDAGSLIEADDDSGRRLFVPTPIGRDDKYLIKSYDVPNDHPANDEPSCWQVYREPAQPLTVEGAVCDPANRDQQFTITRRGDRTYAIKHNLAYLRKSNRQALTLEEVIDAASLQTFRFTDKGRARKPAGG